MLLNSNDHRDFEKIKSGDISHFEKLYKEFFNPILNYANKIVRNRETAEEITQEVFLYLWDKRQQISITTSFSSYLFAATKNKCFNYLKNELPRLQSQIDLTDVIISMEENSSDDYRNNLVKKYTQNAIDDLPTKCREIFILSRYGGLTYEEIAEELELSKKTIENQMGIALKKLRESLKPIIDMLKE